MNEPKKIYHGSLLVDHYEKIRSIICKEGEKLGTSVDLLLRKGMFSWIQSWLKYLPDEQFDTQTFSPFDKEAQPELVKAIVNLTQ